MNSVLNPPPRRAANPISREALIHQLYEAASSSTTSCVRTCTRRSACASVRRRIERGRSDATARWRRDILKVAIEEMGHLTAVWNITAALGGSPRFGR
jgi:hypothetical protein